MSKRRIIDFLPAELRSEDLTNFFAATVDHLFQPGRADHVSGFIGQRPPQYDSAKDFYVPEPTLRREAHQLEPSMVSLNGTAIERVLFYDDLVDDLRSNGAITNNHNRLFEGDYYSWAPPVDLDKLNNYTCYYWFSNAPSDTGDVLAQPIIRLAAPVLRYTSDGLVDRFAMPPVVAAYTGWDIPAVLVDNESVPFNLDGDHVVLVVQPEVGQEVEVFRYGNIRQMMIGRPDFDPRPLLVDQTLAPRITTLSSGQRIGIIDALLHEPGWELTSWATTPWDDELPTFIVDGVGEAITLAVHDTTILDPIYATISRTAPNQNPWSLNNRWVHRDALEFLQGDYSAFQAQRPIIEFDGRIELYRYGSTRVNNVTCSLSGLPLLATGWDFLGWDDSGEDTPAMTTDISDNNDGLGPQNRLNVPQVARAGSGIINQWDAASPLSALAISGKPIGSIVVDDNHPLDVGDRLLITYNLTTGDSDTSPISHRICTVYSVLNDEAMPVYALVPEEDPDEGDITKTRYGREFFFNEDQWTAAQKFVPYSAPLFMLYDNDGNRLSDIDIYPTTRFIGSRLFGYALGDGVPDRHVGQPLRWDANGQILFENDLHTRSYTFGTPAQPITGYFYYRLVTANGDVFANDWHLAADRSSQTYDEISDVFSIPANLQANPDNDEVEFITRGEWFEHFNTIMVAQDGFEGQPYSSNNYRDTAQVLNRGKTILQHRTSLLRTMLLSSDTTFDYMDALRYVEGEYSRFRARFVQKIVQFHLEGTYPNLSIDQTVIEALKSLRGGKTSEFPFALSTVGGGQYFIPPTPTAMGLFEPALPGLFYDDFYKTTMRRGHDGSRQPMFGETASIEWTTGTPPTVLLQEEPIGDVTVTLDGVQTLNFVQTGRMIQVISGLYDGVEIRVSVNDIRDRCLLSLETLIYNNIDQMFRTESEPLFDINEYIESRFAPVTEEAGNYSIDEYNRVLAPIFLAWVQNNQMDFKSNTTFNAADPFTWNYAGTNDRFGRPLPTGSWRGIYRWLFDTDHPHTAPWEMLGFATKPTWWETRYGAAPYTSNNTAMWNDLRDGRIAQGARAGTYARYARPQLLSIIPVGANGSLLNPIQAGIIAQAPLETTASADWQIGDIGPVEHMWRTSPAFSFALAQASYLMKPNRWIETGWDTHNNRLVYGDQWINRQTGDRPINSDLTVHGEMTPTGRKSIDGIQQWIAEHMISKGQTTQIFGDAVRGLTCRLAHKMAGFTTVQSLRVSADNFGIVPPEDTKLVLYSSPSQREEFYSGVIVEWTGEGWRVIGYNALNSTFPTIPGDRFGPTQTIRLEADTSSPIVVEWKPNVYYKLDILVDFEGSTYQCNRPHTSTSTFEQDFWTARPGLVRSQALTVQKFVSATDEVVGVPYGTVFDTQQALADFLFDYERYLVSRGWVFDLLDEESEPLDWTRCVKEYLQWTQLRWAPGNFIALSPGADKLKFSTDHGTIYSLEDSARGVYGIVDRSGMPIDPRDTFVSRLDGEVTVTVRNANLFGVRLLIGEVEHALVLSNETIFGDTIYKPILNIRQPRMRVVGQFAPDWKGRLDAPGYVMIDGHIVPNFEKAAEDIRHAFDIEDVDNTTLRDHARHLLGFEARDHFDNLMLSDTQQFEFYQGMIHQKGSPDVFNKLLRSQFVGEDRTLKFLEEWAFKTSSYGSTDASRRLAFSFNYGDYKRNPQAVRFLPGISTPEMITLTDSDYIEMPAGLRGDIFSERLNRESQIGDMPTAGFVRMSEVTRSLFRIRDLEAIHTDQPLVLGDKLWVYEDSNFLWNVYRVFNLSRDNADNRVTKTVTGEERGDNTGRVRVYFQRSHGLNADNIGARLIVTADTRSSPDLSGVHIIRNVGDEWVEIDAPADLGYVWIPTDESETGAADPENAPSALIMRSMVFPTSVAVTAANAWLKPQTNDFIYYRNPSWVAERWNGSAWVIARQEPNKIDNSSIVNSLIFNTGSRITDNLLHSEPLSRDHLLIFDPVIGNIAGEAERELTFKLEYDPAYYNAGVTPSDDTWGAEEIGQLWWDISAVRFLSAETDVIVETPSRLVRNQEEVEHRITNWGQIAPGTSVDVYEWTRSLSPPTEWSGEGTLYGEGDSWAEHPEFDPTLQRLVTVYYFWVKGSRAIPHQSTNRKLTSETVARILTSPTAEGIPWMAAISRDCIVLSSVEPFLDDATSTVQIEITDSKIDGVTHTQWRLMRKGDDRSLPTQELWDRMVDSIVGMDTKFETVPDDTIHPTSRQGLLVRPRQSLFARPDVTSRASTLAARESLVGIVNQIFSRKVYSDDATPLTMSDTWGATLVENGEEEYYLSWSENSPQHIVLPPEDEYDFVVTSILERNQLVTTAPVKAITSKIRILVNQMQTENPTWTIWEYDPANPALLGLSDFGILAMANSPAQFGNAPLFVPATVAKYQTTSTNVFASLGAQVGDRALVVSPTRKWQVWLYQPTHPRAASSGTSKGWVLTRTQMYSTSDFVSRVDWYSLGYSAMTAPAVTYPNEQTMRSSEKADPINTFVKITKGEHSPDVARWAWLAWDGTRWNEVAREKGTFALSSDLYSPTKTIYANIVADYENRDGSHDLRRILDVVHNDRNVVSAIELNEIFFSMVNFAHAHCDQVNWAFKTSFMHITGYNELLEQTPVKLTDKTDSLLSYIDEVKPYRVKTRDFSRSLSPPLALVNVHAHDFDKPIYRDELNNRYRPLDPTVTSDLEIISSQNPWKEWYEFKATDRVRRFTTRMVFDRIDGANIANPITGDVSSLPSTKLLRPEHVMANSNVGAAQRIDAYYSPVGEMAEKSIRQLMDLDFKGTVVQGDKIRGRLPLDTQVQGTLSANAVTVSMNPDIDGQPGYRIADPYHAAERPQELAVVAHHDCVVFNVHSNGEPGAPRQTVKVYAVKELNRSGNNYIVPIHEIAQTSEAVAVFADGLRITPSYYTVDHFKAEVTMPIVMPSGEPIKRVAVHIFGIGSTNKIIEQKFFVYQAGAPKHFQLGEDGVCEIVINGERFAEIPTIHGGIDLTTTALQDGDQIMMVLREAATTGETTSIRVYHETLPFTGNRKLQVTRPSDALANGTIVEIDGLRIAPSRFTTFTNGALILASNVTVTAASKIEATTFRNSTMLGLNTQTMSGAVNGQYTVTTPASPQNLWVTVNGKRVIQGSDFRVRPNLLVFSPGHVTTDEIIVTTFMGSVAEVAHSFQAASVIPGKDIMRPIMDGDWDVNAWDEEEWDTGDGYKTVTLTGTTYAGERRRLYHMDGGWEYIRVSEAHTSTLAAVLDYSDNTVVVNKKAQSSDVFNVPLFRNPQPDAPGVVWINGERIEYSSMNEVNDNIVLSGIRRGTKGTKIGDEQRTVVQFEGNGLAQGFILPQATDREISGYLVQNGISTPLVPGRDFIVTFTEEGAEITVRTAPPQGSYVTFSQTLVAHQHRINTEVVGASVRLDPRNETL